MRRTLQAALAVPAFAFVASGSIQASIVTYGFGPENFSPTTTDASVSGTDIAATALSAFSVNSFLGYPTPVLQASAPNGNLSGADAVANGHFFSFTVTPDVGYEMDFTSLSFDAARGGGGTPRGYEVRSSVDGFASTLGTADVTTVRPTLSAYSVDLSDPGFDSLASPVEFRVYTYSPNANNTVEYDNFVLDGSVALVPEPSMLATSVLAMGLLSRRRR